MEAFIFAVAFAWLLGPPLIVAAFVVAMIIANGNGKLPRFLRWRR